VMLTIKEMEKMTCKELLVLAKEKDIKGRHSLHKEALLGALVVKYSQEGEQSEQDENEIAAALEVEEARKRKEKYISNLIGGEIIAFKVGGWKNSVLSGKVLEIASESCRVETKNGLRFLVRKENIIWVRTGLRWPKGVFQALKGIERQDAMLN
jgi:sRNA-binding protein